MHTIVSRYIYLSFEIKLLMTPVSRQGVILAQIYDSRLGETPSTMRIPDRWQICSSACNREITYQNRPSLAHCRIYLQMQYPFISSCHRASDFALIFLAPGNETPLHVFRDHTDWAKVCFLSKGGMLFTNHMVSRLLTAQHLFSFANQAYRVKRGEIY